MFTNPERCCLYTALKGVVLDGAIKTSWPLCTPPSVTCVHLCVSEGFGLCEVIQDVKFYGLAELVHVQSSVDLSWISSIGLYAPHLPSHVFTYICVSEGFGLCEVIHDVKFYGLVELIQVQSSVDLSWISSIGLQCKCSSLCYCFFFVVATLEASDWLVFCSCKPSLALLQSSVIFYIVILFWFSTLFFLIISHYAQIFKMWHNYQICHTLFISHFYGETDGVTLSRLDCMCKTLWSTSSKISKTFTHGCWLCLIVVRQPWRHHSLTSHNWTQWAAWRAAQETQMWLHCCTGGWKCISGGGISRIGAESWKNRRRDFHFGFLASGFCGEGEGRGTVGIYFFGMDGYIFICCCCCCWWWWWISEYFGFWWFLDFGGARVHTPLKRAMGDAYAELVSYLLAEMNFVLEKFGWKSEWIELGAWWMCRRIICIWNLQLRMNEGEGTWRKYDEYGCHASAPPPFGLHHSHNSSPAALQVQHLSEDTLPSSKFISI